MSHHPKDAENAWLIQQKKDDKHHDNLLKTMVGRRNNGQQPPVTELEQPQCQKSENNSEKRVIPR